MDNCIQTSQKKVGLYIRSAGETSSSLQEKVLFGQLSSAEHPLYLSSTRIFSDIARSGLDRQRSGLRKILYAAQNKEIDVVFVMDLSRLSRSLEGLSEIFSVLKNSECELWEMRRKIELEDFTAGKLGSMGDV